MIEIILAIDLVYKKIIKLIYKIFFNITLFLPLLLISGFVYFCNIALKINIINVF